MFISQTPINLPVSTANIAVESLVKEASTKPQIPETPPSTQSSNSKHSTDFSEQNKPDLLNALFQDKSIKEQSEENNQEPDNQEDDDKNSDQSSAQAIDKTDQKGFNENELNLDRTEQQQVAKLQARDREVRAHEAAHASVGGSFAGSPNLSFTSGPDGKRYATSGDVSIDIAKVANDPAATIAKLEQVQRAALAPAQPSSQDRKVAAIASAGISEAQVELRLENLENSKIVNEKSNENNSDKGEGRFGLSLTNSPSNENINPVRAKRESRALEQKIQDSGALPVEKVVNQLSVTA